MSKILFDLISSIAQKGLIILAVVMFLRGETEIAILLMLGAILNELQTISGKIGEEKSK